MTRPRLITAAVLADELGIDIKTVRRRTRAGDFPFAINIGDARRPMWRYDVRLLDRWLESRRHTL